MRRSLCLSGWLILNFAALTCPLHVGKERYGGTEFGGSDLIEKKKLDVVCERCGHTRLEPPLSWPSFASLSLWSWSLSHVANKARPGAGLRLMTSADAYLSLLIQGSLAMVKFFATLWQTLFECMFHHLSMPTYSQSISQVFCHIKVYFALY